MRTLLKEAIAVLQTLPEPQQDRAASTLLAFARELGEPADI
jgi:hypothetical protein